MVNVAQMELPSAVDHVPYVFVSSLRPLPTFLLNNVFLHRFDGTSLVRGL